ncbi:MAG: Crp/Fnr family transcriptional regulator [Chloroflexi bacterium]|nr:MAG: Crp/Fnr family transcriptional regulator [Chloroflexota bacterium]
MTSARRGRRDVDLSGTRLSDIAGRGFLGRLSPDLAEEVLQSGRLASYPAGTVISSSREESGPALVVSGSLRYFLSAPDGRQLTIRYLLPGDLVGTAIAEQSNVASHIELLEPGVLLHLDRDRSVRTRLAMDLVERAKMRGPLRAGLEIDVTQQSLADATGSVREVVSRALGQLRREGVVARNADGITVLDPDALIRAAGV